MDFDEFRLRIAPWFMLVSGIGWIILALFDKDVRFFPGFNLIAAAFLLFTLLKWRDRRVEQIRSQYEDQSEAD